MDIDKLLAEFRSFRMHIDWNTDGEHDEPNFASPGMDNAGPPLVKLPPSPFRSLGGYFSYEGWPDQQRFMELDKALRRNARENRQSRRPPGA